MDSHILQAGVLLGSTYVLWRLLRRFVTKSPLSDIPGPPNGSWSNGNVGQLFGLDGWGFHQRIAEDYGAVCKVYGVFGEEQLYVSDPVALHHMIIKDPESYEVPSMIVLVNELTFGPGLLSTQGASHRRQRKMLNPAFSPKAMREITPIFYPIALTLRDILAKKVEDGEEEIDLSTWMSRAALEYIGQGGMGYQFDALHPEVSNKYHDAAKLFVPNLVKLTFYRELLPYLTKMGTPNFRRRVLSLWPEKSVKNVVQIVDTMEKQATEIYVARKKEVLEDNINADGAQPKKGKDILSTLLKANMAAKEEDRLSEEELLGQLNTIVFAGHDTTSSILSRALHMLSMNKELQTRLREEVSAAREEQGDLDYDTLMNLPLLDAICRETLRLFPPLSLIPRTVSRDTVLPLAWPVKSADGKSEIREIPLCKDTKVIISIYNSNRSKAVWGEDAHEWKPERWIGKQADEVVKARFPGVYSSMMTFLGGARACIGFKFSELEMKLVLSILIETFEFSLGSKEIYWTMGLLAQPTFKGSESNRPCLPLKLTLAKKA